MNDKKIRHSLHNNWYALRLLWSICPSQVVYRAIVRLLGYVEQMYEKAAELDLACYDDPKYYNEFVLAVAESETSIDRFLTLLNSIMQSITIVVTTGVFFLMTDAVGILFVLVSFVLNFVLSKALNKVNYKARLRINPWERKRSYASLIFYLNDYAKELRLNPEIETILREDFEAANDEIIREQKKMAGKRTGLL